MLRRNLLTAGLSTAAMSVLSGPATTWAAAGASSTALGSGPVPAGGLTPGQKLQRLLHPRDVPAAAPQRVRVAYRHAVAAFDAVDYTGLLTTLPALGSLAHSTYLQQTDEDGQRAMAAICASVQTLASQVATKLSEDPIAYQLADRALVLAHLGGEPDTIASASRALAISVRRAGHPRRAADLLIDAAVDLDSQHALSHTTGSAQGAANSSGPQHLPVYGSLLLTAAYTSAQAGDRHQALDLLTEADTAARRLGAPDRPRRGFSREQVMLYRIGVHLALGDSGQALTASHRVRPNLLPTAERRARYHVDTARAWHQHGNRAKAIQSLLAAEHQASDEVTRPAIRTLITTLLNEPGHQPKDFLELRRRSGAAV